PQDPAAAILGRWEGTSICIKAEWNRACHDEVTRYDFVRDTLRPDVITVHSYKQLGTDWDWMGDVDLRYDAAGHRWAGEWQNSRVHIEWSYWLTASGMAGQVVIFPDRRKGRDVVAHRVTAG
ncbi:MAG TPA: hypothetical protein VL295_04155, partial [Gemmatimonadales bacterium]|nr:hypothetical protein [Gemmatimonadales bacterium]